MWQIREGLEQKLDVSVYAHKEYSWKQMYEIRLGLFSNIDVSIYAKKDFDWKEMREKREKLENEQNTQ